MALRRKSPLYYSAAMVSVHGSGRRAGWSQALLLLTALTWTSCRYSEGEEPAFPDRVEESCRTRQGCHQLLQKLTQKRDYCFRTYGSADRPPDCDDNDLYWWALKDHIELTELQAQRRQQACTTQLAAIAEERKKLEQERRRWHDERERAARSDKQWRDLDPRKCALEGDEAECYHLVRFIALGPSPHLDEAKAALAAGQKLIDQRK
jgi:hypothetical protein